MQVLIIAEVQPECCVLSALMRLHILQLTSIQGLSQLHAVQGCSFHIAIATLPFNKCNGKRVSKQHVQDMIQQKCAC